MHTSARLVAGLALLASVFALTRPVAAQKDDVLPPGPRPPRLVLTHAGPHAPVTALAFAPDGSALYVAGFDKQVRRYALVDGAYKADGTFRVPIGPGNGGLINALAVSPDGKWVAAAGRAPIRGEVWAGADDGIEESVRFDPEDVRGDVGIVYLFDPKNPDGGKAIRGQLSGVRALVFAIPSPADGPVLVTTGVEWNEKGDYFGTVRVFNAESGKQLASRADLPPSDVPPAIAAWATGVGNKQLRVAVAWDAADRKPGKLLVWNDPGTPGAKTERPDDGVYNSTLAVRRGADGAVAELLTGGFHPGKGGGLTVRRPDGTAKPLELITGKDKHAYLPVGVAALSTKGIPATAVLSRVLAPGGAVQHELRLLAPGAAAPIELDGINEDFNPVLAASPDGRFLAVGGFTNNRVEVYDATALVAGKVGVVQKLEGATGGFAQVAFLAGEKLWFGKPTDSLEKGGVILDLNAKVRTAVPRGAKEELKLDKPAGAEPKIEPGDLAKKQPWRVVATVGGAEKTITLPVGEIATAAAFLPAKPAWDATLGPVVAVAAIDHRTQSVQLTLYDPLTLKSLYKLGGPTLSVRSLAFSGTRPLLAGAGDDGTVAVWSLKNVSRPVPMIEGLLITKRAGKVVVASVQKTSPANGKLAPGDVIDSVVDGAGNVKAVKETLDFMQTVRSLKIGAEAKIAVKDKVVAVKVGTATGFRLPLFDLWVEPLPKAGQHAWVGWTSSGPYDASDADGEARIGWLTATGDPTRPVTVAGADQYRKLFYTPDFIRRLVETANYSFAVVPPKPPKLEIAFPGAVELPDGRSVTREKLDATVTLTDPDRVVDVSRAELRWQVIGPDGASEWSPASFTGAQATIKLTDRAWKRGEYSVRAKLHKTANSAPLIEAGAAVWYIPPAAEFAVRIDGNAVKPDAVVTAANEKEAEVAVAVDPKTAPQDVVVTVSWTGGGDPVELARNATGFDPKKIPLTADEAVVRVTVTNRGAPPTAADESRAVEVRVRKPVKIPAPVVTLKVLTPCDDRPTATGPYVVSTQKVQLFAEVTDANPITAFQWKIADGEWEDGKLVPTANDPKMQFQTREIDLSKFQKDDKKDEDAPVVVQVRAKSAKSDFGTDTASVRYDGLPDVSVAMPPTLITKPELNLSGGLKITGKRRFAVRVLVTSSRTGQTREFPPMVNATLTGWEAGITLFPGGNQLGYVVRYDNDRKELRRAGLVEVQYVRPPVVLGGAPLAIGTGSSGALALAVASAGETVPGLLVNGAAVGVQTTKQPVRVFGASLWMLTAAGVPANPGADREKPVSVIPRNGERDGPEFRVAVQAEPDVVIAPPTFLLKYRDGTIAPDQPLPPVGEPDFTFDLQVRSATRLTRVEVRHGTGPGGDLEPVSGVSAADAVPEGEGSVLTARPTVQLRDGFRNYMQVIATNGGKPVTFGFYATYTPAPVRVQIDSIKEPNGQLIAVTRANANLLEVAKGEIEIRGRVLWTHDNDPVANDSHLSVVFVANGVGHVPVLVSKVVPGEGRVRTFSGRVYLNSPDPKSSAGTRVRAELRSGLRAVPQVGLERAAIIVTSKAPITRQRLHVLIFGVDVPEASQGALIRKVITSIGGKIPANNPNFTEGEFKQDKFEFAQLYRPQFIHPQVGHLNKMMDRVRANIVQRSRTAGDEWVNDVVLLYYQGADWKDEKSGRWLLHTATTLNEVSGPNTAGHAIRPDDLPSIPGMLVTVVNATGSEMKGDPLAIETPHLRYAWKDRSATDTLLGAFEKAVTQQRTVEQMRMSVDADLKNSEKSAGRFGFLPDAVLARVIGLKP